VPSRPCASHLPVRAAAGRPVLGLLGVVVLGTAIAGAVVPPQARADPAGPRIAGGTSPSGQRWTMRAHAEGPRIVLSTSLPLADGDGGEIRSFPSRSREPLDVGEGSGFGSADEWEIDGVAYRTVARLRVTTSDGGTVSFRPRHAPDAVVRRIPQLAHFRYFARFFPTSQQPVAVSALSPGGRVIATHRLD
jgi:hypothetical protein